MKDYFGIRAQTLGLQLMPARDGKNGELKSGDAMAQKAVNTGQNCKTPKESSLGVLR
jgi:hypothetical protein